MSKAYDYYYYYPFKGTDETRLTERLIV